MLVTVWLPTYNSLGTSVTEDVKYCCREVVYFCCLLGAVVKQEIKSCSLTAELTKKQLQSKAEMSLVVWRTLSQRNRMNTTNRGIVNNMQV